MFVDNPTCAPGRADEEEGGITEYGIFTATTGVPVVTRHTQVALTPASCRLIIYPFQLKLSRTATIRTTTTTTTTTTAGYGTSYPPCAIMTMTTVLLSRWFALLLILPSAYSAPFVELKAIPTLRPRNQTDSGPDNSNGNNNGTLSPQIWVSCLPSFTPQCAC